MNETFFLLPAVRPWAACPISLDPSDLLHGLYAAIGNGCDCIEAVAVPQTGLFSLSGILLICDESGLYRDEVNLNRLATFLLDGCRPPSASAFPVVGNVVFARSGVRNGDPDIVGLSQSDLDFFRSVLL